MAFLVQTGYNENGDPDSTCADLLTRIISICHTTEIDWTLFPQYQHQLNQNRNLPSKSPKSAGQGLPHPRLKKALFPLACKGGGLPHPRLQKGPGISADGVGSRAMD